MEVNSSGRIATKDRTRGGDGGRKEWGRGNVLLGIFTIPLLFLVTVLTPRERNTHVS